MAITLSAAVDKGYVGAGHTPRIRRYEVTAVEAESGDIEVEHLEGRAADKVDFVQLTGTGNLLGAVWKRSADDEDNTTVTLATVGTGGYTFFMDLHFYGNDSPDVTE